MPLQDFRGAPRLFDMSEEQNITALERGAQVIQGYVKRLPDTPGVYRMLSESGEALYVGKAKSLKKRVVNYTRPEALPIRLQRMIALTREMEFVHTQTEAEALLLESNLIKKLKPKYNVLLRDDKSFPYILMTGDHDFPQVVKHRGAKKREGQYYGPFASAGDVNRTIAILQRVFALRDCSDTYFAQRTRPCLQYHIKRCTAPCVGKVSKAGYAEQTREAQAFLDGKSDAIQKRMANKMQEASAAQDYEAAAVYRDRIQALSSIQARQDINVAGLVNADVMALAQKEGRTCVQVFFFRAGRNYGNRSYFPRHDKDEEPAVVMAAFMAQFYENKPTPKEILVNVMPDEKALLEEAFASKAAHKVGIAKPQRGGRKRVVDFARRNACEALARNLVEKAGEAKLLKCLADLFGMDETPSRIEVYDNSHISGTNMVGGMIVAGPEGFNKSAYRKFNIRTAEASDDFGMMREVMERRFKRALKEHLDMDGAEWPDLLLVDGGKGQLSAVAQVLEDYGVLDALTVVAISKGPERNAGREQFHMIGRASFQLPVNDAVLHYLQRLRDEAHRYAIGTHRARRQKEIAASPLDGVPGVGTKRKKALLAYFGSGKAVTGASVKDLQKVEGVSKSLAQAIYDHFH
ncbi:MAG: excinuclease ABC subunit UvrC [Rhodospirillales bacterium]|nr:excinuclease ABC subunit UvrC [Rhodospirillales bacterium]